MSEYISREEAIKSIYDGTNMDIYTREVKETLESLPSADVRENIHGYWELKYPTRKEVIYCQERYFCSNCKDYVVDRIARLEFNFCPNCGADMKGDKE